MCGACVGSAQRACHDDRRAGRNLQQPQIESAACHSALLSRIGAAPECDVDMHVACRRRNAALETVAASGVDGGHGNRLEHGIKTAARELHIKTHSGAAPGLRWGAEWQAALSAGGCRRRGWAGRPSSWHARCVLLSTHEPTHLGALTWPLAASCKRAQDTLAIRALCLQNKCHYLHASAEGYIVLIAFLA